MSPSFRDYWRVGTRLGLRFCLNRPLVAAFLALAMVLLVASFIFRWVESDSEHPLWRTVVYSMSGLDVDPPHTTPGQTAAVVVLLTGVVFASFLTGYIASKFSRLFLMAQCVPHKPDHRVFENHVIFLGWNTKVRAILQELDNCYASAYQRRDQFVVVSSIDRLERGTAEIYGNVWHVWGKATDTDVMHKADLTDERGAGARIAVIIPDRDQVDGEQDRRSLLQLLAVEHLFPEVISIVELKCQENKPHFENAYADLIVEANSFSSELLAQTAEYPGLAQYMDKLVSSKQDSFSGRQQSVSVKFFSAGELDVAGLTFTEATLRCYERASVLPVGLFKEGGVALYPDLGLDHSERLLVREDCLVVVSGSGVTG